MIRKPRHACYDRVRHGTHNFGRPDVIADPTLYIDALRELDPVFYDEVGRVWVCSGYEASQEVLKAVETFSSARSATSDQLSHRRLDGGSTMLAMVVNQLLFSDPPKHTEIRGLMREYFTSARVRAHHDEIDTIVATALERLPSSGPVELISEYAGGLSVSLAAALLGLEGAEDRLTTWADAYGTLLGSLSSLPDVRDAGIVPALQEALGTLRAEAERRLDDAPHDLLSHMAVRACAGLDTAADRAEWLNIVAANTVVLVAGGYKTLAHLISTGLVLLKRHPEQLRLLADDPELIDSAIDEFMRLDGSSQYLARRATKDTTLGDCTISEGETVLVHLAAANLDPNTFVEPRTLDITRRGTKHLGFGMGRHFCIGAPYAQRLAGQAILRFIDRYDYVLDDDVDDRWSGHPNTRCRARCAVTAAARTAAPLADRASNSPRLESHLDRSAPDPATVAEWNYTSTPLGVHQCWHHHIEQLASDQPGATAVETVAGDRFTYGWLDRRANATAHWLRSRGVEQGRAVAVVMARGVELVVAMLAVSKAGAAFMLCEPDAPVERVKGMVEDAGAELILTDTSTWESAAVLADPWLRARTTVPPATTDDNPPRSAVSAGDTAYLVFTSGSTGRPKAIAVRHDGLVNLHIAQMQVVRPNRSDRVLQFFSLNFDGCIWDFTLALMSGATLVVAPTDELAVGPDLVRLVDRVGVTVVTLTPSVWEVLPVAELPSLRLAAAAGERLTQTVVSRWRRPGRRFLNLYGPAEAAVWTTWHECTEEEVPPIGRPVANKRLYLVDEHLSPVAVGQEGELCIAGLGLGRYLGRPDLMETKFVPEPDPGRPHELMYRTGDICRSTPTGVLEFVGRRDRQIKVRGQRVELDEVEVALTNIEDVDAAMVSARDDRKLHAAVVTSLWTVPDLVDTRS